MNVFIYYRYDFVLQPSRHIKVMSSAVSYPIHTVPGQASLVANQY